MRSFSEINEKECADIARILAGKENAAPITVFLLNTFRKGKNGFITYESGVFCQTIFDTENKTIKRMIDGSDAPLDEKDICRVNDYLHNVNIEPLFCNLQN